MSAKARSWDDYSLGRAPVLAHLGALDLVYRSMIDGYRGAIDELTSLIPSHRTC